MFVGKLGSESVRCEEKDWGVGMVWVPVGELVFRGVDRGVLSGGLRKREC